MISNKRTILAPVLMLLVLLTVVGCSGATPEAQPVSTEAVSRPTSTQAPPATATEAPTRTPAPTETAEPTETPEPTETRAPTRTPAPTNTPLPTATPDSFASGGLGLSREAWEAAGHEATGDGILGTLYDGPLGVGVEVAFDDAGRAWYLERQYRTPVTPEDAEVYGATLIPADAEQLQRYSPEGRPETVVVVFRSPSLAERFAPERFIGAEPGTFVILYNQFDGEVSRLIVALGNNP